MEATNSTTHPTIATREEWLEARKTLLEKEKKHTRQSDELARQRQELPWVRIDKKYTFQTDEGEKTLAELFDGRSQLIVFHLMYGPNDDAACPGCSWMTDHVDGAVVHLNHHDVTFVAASRAPLEKLNAYKKRMDWSLPWVSTIGADFNIDFSLFTDEQKRTGAGLNFGTPKRADLRLAPIAPDGVELHGVSVFALDDDVVYHTYSTFDRGTDVFHGTWQLLDRTPKGRFKTPSSDGVASEEDFDWPRRHDEYDD